MAGSINWEELRLAAEVPAPMFLYSCENDHLLAVWPEDFGPRECKCGVFLEPLGLVRCEPWAE